MRLIEIVARIWVVELDLDGRKVNLVLIELL